MDAHLLQMHVHLLLYYISFKQVVEILFSGGHGDVISVAF